LDISVGILYGGSARHKAFTYTGEHYTEKHEHTSTTRTDFEPKIQVFERSKTVRASDREAIGTGIYFTLCG